MKFSKIYLVFMFIIFVAASCSKEDSIEKQNTEDSKITDSRSLPDDELNPVFVSIQRELEAREKSEPFVNQFLVDFGIPVWSSTLIFDSNENSLMTITPITNNENTSVTSLLYYQKEDGNILFNIVIKADLENTILEALETSSITQEQYQDLFFMNHANYILFNEKLDLYVQLELEIKESMSFQSRNQYVPEYILIPCDLDATISAHEDCFPITISGVTSWYRYVRIMVWKKTPSGSRVWQTNGTSDNNSWWNGNNGSGDGSGSGSGGGSGSTSGDGDETGTDNNNFWNELDTYTKILITEVTEEFLSENNINISVGDFVDIIGLDCYEDVVESGFTIGTILDSDCATSVYESYLIWSFEQEYGIELTEEEKTLLEGINDLSDNFYTEVIATLAEDYMASNTIAQQASDVFLSNYSVDEDLLNHRDRLIFEMKINSEFAEYIESSFGWSSVMWTIAKELIGDKLIDILGDALVGGAKQDILDAIKAAKNGDPLGVIYNAALVVGKNSPLGKAIKAVEVSVEMTTFLNKISKVWDKIETYADNVIEEMWTIIEKYPDALRINTDLIAGIAKTINRGLKTVDDMVLHAGVNHIDNNTVSHILRGDGFNSGRHHISALVADPSIQITHIIDKGDGFYKASLRKAGNPPLTMDDKSFFPDNWDEFEVLDAIKQAYDSNPTQSALNTVTFEGIFNGRVIKIVKENGIIKTAFPK